MTCREWTGERLRLAVVCAVVAAAVGALRGAAPGRDLGALAIALSRAAGGARVSPADVRWEPSAGGVSDAAIGRWSLFLAGDDARDVWRARVRVSPEGSVIAVVDAHNLTSTPLGDDHQLVVRGRRAAFATRAYGQEQSVTVLDLAGDGRDGELGPIVGRAMTAISRLQRTGAPRGVGRLDVILESPARSVGLAIGESALDIALVRGDPRRPPTLASARFDLSRGDIDPPTPGLRVDGVIHLPKRFSHWMVDTLRAVSWIGPEPIAWAEDQALAVRDTYRRLTFQASGGATDVVAAVAPLPPVLDTSEESVQGAHWPPTRVATIWKSPEQGEGEWVVPNVPWLRRPPAAAPDAPSAFYQTFLRPDDERPYSRVLLVAMDARQLDLDMEAGVEDPEPLTGPPGSGRIPRDPAVYTRVAAAFNGAFKTEHGHYGMMVKKRVLLPPVPAAASVVVLDDGRVGFGTWGSERKVGGIAGVDDDMIASFRQNLDPLIDHGRINPTGRNMWGFTLPGKGAQTERTGLCVTTSGHLLYAWGDDLSATALARAMAAAGCDYAMHLDMNPYHTGFLFTAIDDFSTKKIKSQLLTPAMSIPVDRYVQYAPKDFFYVMVHDPRPPPIQGAGPWHVDGGVQPPPSWLPGLWTTQIESAEGRVDLVDVEPGRAKWRIRAGSDAPAAASPLRDLEGSGAQVALLAIGMGVSQEKQPLGLATDGRLAVAVHGGSAWGALVVGPGGAMAIHRADDAPVLGAHDDLAELPVVLWDGQPVTAASGPAAARAAIGVSPSGRVVVARGSVTSVAPLVAALAGAGCTRALSLDRGHDATARVDRAGTVTPPRARYEESVIYALGTPLFPRAFRFEPTAPPQPR